MSETLQGFTAELEEIKQLGVNSSNPTDKVIFVQSPLNFKSSVYQSSFLAKLT